MAPLFVPIFLSHSANMDDFRSRNLGTSMITKIVAQKLRSAYPIIVLFMSLEDLFKLLTTLAFGGVDLHLGSTF